MASSGKEFLPSTPKKPSAKPGDVLPKIEDMDGEIKHDSSNTKNPFAKKVIGSRAFQQLRNPGADANKIKTVFSPLGNVSDQNTYLFTNDNDQLKTFASDFLTALYTERGKEITQHHLDKIKTRPAKRQTQPVTPSCISIALIEKESKDSQESQFLISISEHSDAFKDVLKDFIKQDHIKKRFPTAALLLDCNPTYNEAIKEIVAELEKTTQQQNQPDKWVNPNRLCAEKPLIVELTKLFNIDKKNMSVKGIVNYHFYPYKKDVSYGKDCDDKSDCNYFVTTPNEKAQSAGGYLFPEIACCNSCQTNKNAYLAAMVSAQESVMPFGMSPQKIKYACSPDKRDKKSKRVDLLGEPDQPNLPKAAANKENMSSGTSQPLPLSIYLKFGLLNNTNVKITQAMDALSAEKDAESSVDLDNLLSGPGTR